MLSTIQHPQETSVTQASDFPSEGGSVEGLGINDVMLQLSSLISNSHDIVPSRLGETKECRYLTIISHEPSDRIIRVPERGANLVAQIAETLWVLGGSKELKYLTPFLKRAPQFSDDGGVTWRSGYGARLRKGAVDQLAVCESLLKSDPTTRRAFAIISDPSVDHNPGIDVACNVFMSFIVRNNMLHLNVFNRSNDFIWGFTGINYFEFSAILEYMCNSTKLMIGSYVHYTQSMHVYAPYYELLEKVYKVSGEEGRVDDIVSFDRSRHIPFVGGSLAEYDQLFKQYTHRLDMYFAAVNTRDGHEILSNAASEFMSVIRQKPGFSIAIYFCIPFLELIFKDMSYDASTKRSLLNNFNSYCDSVAKNSYLKEAINTRFLKYLEKQQNSTQTQPII